MRLIAKVITIAYTNFHCNKLTTVQDSFKITRVSFFGTQCSSSDNRIHCTKHICKNYVILHISEKTTHAGIVFTQWSKNRFFAPQGRHVAPINVKFGTGKRCGPLPNAKCHVYRGINGGIQPQNC